MSDRDTTADLMAALRRHYQPPLPKPQPGRPTPPPQDGGIFVEECGLNGATGRRVDALHVGFTTASGRILTGHEVKASRSDWRNELNKVGKADLWADACHAWYIVAPPGIVPVDELPAEWGLLEPSTRPNARRMTVVKPAHVHTDRVPPWRIVRSIMARNDTLAADRIRTTINNELNRLRDEIREQATEAARNSTNRRLTADEVNRLGVLDAIEDALGAKVETYGGWGDNPSINPEQAAAALALIRAGQGLRFPAYVVEEARRVAEKLGELEQTAAAWQKITGSR